MQRGWRLGMLAREAALNVLVPRARMAAVLAVAAMLGSCVAVFSASEAQTFAARLAALEARGTNVVVFQSSSRQTEVAISRSSCETLATVPGVRRAGVLVEEGTRDLPELGARISVFAASSTLFPRLSAADGIVGAGLAGPGPARQGQAHRRVTFGVGDVRLLAVAAPEPEGIPSNRAVILPLSARADTAPRCIVQFERFQNVSAQAAALAPQLVVTGGSVTGRPALTPTVDPVSDWRDRAGQWVAVALGIIGGLLSSALVWTRSNDLAAYRLSGTRRRCLALLLTFETVLTAGAFVFSGVTASLVARSDTIGVPEAAMWLFAGGAAWCLSALPGTLRSVLTSPESLTRER